MLDLVTNFSYKDDRSYINSSTMCAFLGEMVVPALGLQAVDTRMDAQFHRPATMNGVMRCQEAPSDMRSSPAIAAEFRLTSGTKNFYIYFIEDQKPISNWTDTKYEIQDLKLLSPFAGSCHININNELSFFENIIEANKRLHQYTLDDKKINVINLYMKKIPLGLMYQKKGMYLLNIQHIGSRSHNDGLATINEFSFAELNLSTFQMCYSMPGVTL